MSIETTHEPADEAAGLVPVRINGDERRVPRDRTLAELLDELELDPRAVVVELNRDIVRREDLGDVTVEAGDHVEIVQFVGGG